MEKDDKYLVEETCTLKDNLKLSEMSKDDNLLENSVSISNSFETFQESRGKEAEIKEEVNKESSNTLDISLDTLKDTVEDNEYLDIKESENSCKQKTDELEAEIENESLDPLDMSSCALKDTDEDEWLDILGNGSFKKKVVVLNV
ncbi:uncharacterized protein TNCV_3446941 [Trichonephila clavipes]|nr:uncharacterized protein TNCV_3446941 [Trichonephila clavipes]